MDFDNEVNKRELFRNILFELSLDILSSKEQDSIIRRLEALYYVSSDKPRFRHFYSDIFSVLTSIQKEEPLKHSIDILGLNLGQIHKCYTPRHHDSANNLIDISENINKLFDHVNLELAHLRYLESADREIASRTEIDDVKAKSNALSTKIDKLTAENEKLVLQATDVQSKSNALSNQIDELTAEKEKLSTQTKELEQKLKESSDKAQSAQKEYIAILGIFAAVALTFTGGLAFSTSVLQNLHLSSVYRISIAALIIGLVLIDSLYGLFFCLNHIIKDKSLILKPFIITNTIFIVLIGIVCLYWSSGYVESRNRRIESELAVEDTIQSPADTRQPPTDAKQPPTDAKQPPIENAQK